MKTNTFFSFERLFSHNSPNSPIKLCLRLELFLGEKGDPSWDKVKLFQIYSLKVFFPNFSVLSFFYQVLMRKSSFQSLLALPENNRQNKEKKVFHFLSMFNSNNVITHEICQGLMASGSWIMSRQTHFFDVCCQLLETFFDISDEQTEIGADRDEQVGVDEQLNTFNWTPLVTIIIFYYLKMKWKKVSGKVMNEYKL